LSKVIVLTFSGGNFIYHTAIRQLTPAILTGTPLTPPAMALTQKFLQSASGGRVSVNPTIYGYSTIYIVILVHSAAYLPRRQTLSDTRDNGYFFCTGHNASMLL
jgi:hypothetical protein